MDAETTFTSDQLTPGDALVALRAAGFELGPARPVRRTLLDTFDGRLHAAGLRLEVRQAPQLSVVLAGKGSPPARAPVDAVPRTADDLPAGPLRSRLAPVLDGRALLPVICVTAREATATRRDHDGKARVSVMLHDRVSVEGHEAEPTWAAEVVALAGYEKDAARARDRLGALGLRAERGDVIDAAATRAGVDLRGYAGSPTVPLHGEEPALEAFRRVLANLAAAIETNWQGTVDDVDSEFLHDLRVAVRRTRSVLAQGKNVIGPAARDRYREEFGWLGAGTGPARDLDVYLIEWPSYVAPLGADAAAALEPVIGHIRRRRGEERTALERMLRSRRYHTLMLSWRSWLADPPPEDSGEDARTPVAEVVTARTRQAQKRLLAHGRSIGPESPAEDLHELRKDAKKLRYLLECFGGLYAPRPRKAFVQRLKALQDNLGEHQDAEVHVTELRAMSSELHGAPGVDAGTLLAMGRLTEHLERHREAAREEFAERFASYDDKKTGRTFTELLDSVQAAAPGKPAP